MSKSLTFKSSLGLIKALKPRNPLVAPAHQRQAGRHELTPGAQRQALRRAWIRDLAGFELPPDDFDVPSKR